MFACLECGKVFRSVRAAERAAYNGCPGCGGVDIDVAVLDRMSDFEMRALSEEMARRTGGEFHDDANALDVTFERF